MPRALAYCHAPLPPRSSFIENTTSSTLAQVNKDKKKPEHHDAPALPLAYTLPDAAAPHAVL
jgi:hypothetical protein